MDLTLHPAERLEGTVEVPPSKSYTHRALLCASLAMGTSDIRNGLRCDDTGATLRACRAFGARISGRWERLRVEGFGGCPRRPPRAVDAGESGTTLRLLTPLAGLVGGGVVLGGRGSLRDRPNGFVVPLLRRMGVEVRGRGPDHRVPLRIQSPGFLSGADLVLRGDIYSSQFLSGLLLAAPLARGETRIRVEGRLVSRPYIDVTLDAMGRASVDARRRGLRFHVPGGQTYRPFRFKVGGDWSAAANWLVAGCLVESDLRLEGLAADAQGDRAVLRFLEAMGAEFRVGRTSVRVRGPFHLRGRSLDLSNHPDLVPPLAVAGGFASGTTVLRGISHLRLKESDRLGGLAATLRALGIRARATRDALAINGSRSRPRSSAAVPAGGDHRVAMALAVAALRGGPVTIRGFEAVSKSYPRFAEDLRAVGAGATRAS